MTETQAKQHIRDMLVSYTPGTLLHFFAQVIREAEEDRLGFLDDRAEERVLEAEPS